MPEYLYQHPSNSKVISLVQSVNDKHEYIDSKGKKWNRIFTSPQINTQEKLSANSSDKDFARVTSSQRSNVGDLFDRSEELSDKRKQIYGKDPIKDKYFKDWSKKRKGKKHPKSHESN
jgi:hypothetical protein